MLDYLQGEIVTRDKMKRPPIILFVVFLFLVGGRGFESELSVWGMLSRWCTRKLRCRGGVVLCAPPFVLATVVRFFELTEASEIDILIRFELN